MSRRRDQRGRRQGDTSDRSKRILQISLVSAGVLLLLIAMVIAVGLPMGSSLLANDGSSGDNGGDGDKGGTQTPATTSTESKQEEQKTTTTEEQTTTEQQTTTTQQTQQQPQNPGQLRTVETEDRDGNGYYSNFNLEVQADTTQRGNNGPGNGGPYFLVTINGQDLKPTEHVERRPNGQWILRLSKSTLRNHQTKQGPMQVKVTLLEGQPGNGEEIESWTTTIRYEPRDSFNR